MGEQIHGLDVYAASSYQVAVSAGRRVMRKVPLTASVDVETGAVTFSVPVDQIDQLRQD